MSVWRRGLLFLYREKRKTAILFITLTVILVLVFAGISMHNAMQREERRLRENVSGYFTIRQNDEQGSRKFVDDEMVEKIIAIEGVKSWNGIDMAHMYVKNIELIPGRFTLEKDERAQMTQVWGNTRTELNENFVLDFFTLSQGRHLTYKDTDKVIVSETLANRNNLKIGDHITLYPDTGGLQDEQIQDIKGETVQIVGTYRGENMYATSDTAECDIEQNFIFSNTEFIRKMQKQITGNEIQEYSQGVTFFVKDAKKIDNIVKEVQEILGDSRNQYVITKNNRTYEELSLSLNRMIVLLSSIVAVIMLASIIILSMVQFLWMRGRQHETGIFLSIGIGKREIFSQHLLENAVIMFVAFLCSWGSIFLLTDFLKYIVGGIEVHIRVIEVVEVLGIGYLIILISTAMALVKEFQMQPKDVLSKE